MTKNIDFSKKRYQGFLKNPLFFYVTITGNFEHFHYHNFETSSMEKRHFFRKLEYRFLLESTTIGNATFPYKTTLLETNVKTNSIGSTDVPQRTEFSH